MRSSRITRTVAVALGATALLGLSAPAQAFSWHSSDCSSFARCDAAGLGNAGYENDYTTSHWGMYGGHNCTNYAAYRVMAAGVDASYLRGQGNAYQWGTGAAAHGVAVDKNPRVGDVAWFTASSTMGRSGHVAYVETVDATSGRVRVSEDNWGGDFDWRWYDIADVTGFIHFGSRAVSSPVSGSTATGSPSTGSPVTGSSAPGSATGGSTVPGSARDGAASGGSAATPGGTTAPGPTVNRPAAGLTAKLKVPSFTAATTASVPVTWSGADRYTVQYRVGAASGDGIVTYSGNTTWKSATVATGATFVGSPGGFYQFRVRAVDSAGGAGVWSAWSAVAMPTDDPGLTATGPWTAGRSTKHYNGTYRYTTQPGAAVSATAWTNRIVVLGAKSFATGKADLWVDGVNRGTIDTFRPSSAHRQVLASITLPYGLHTVNLVNEATPDRPYLYVDGIAFQRPSVPR